MNPREETRLDRLLRQPCWIGRDGLVGVPSGDVPKGSERIGGRPSRVMDLVPERSVKTHDSLMGASHLTIETDEIERSATHPLSVYRRVCSFRRQAGHDDPLDDREIPKACLYLRDLAVRREKR